MAGIVTFTRDNHAERIGFLFLKSQESKNTRDIIFVSAQNEKVVYKISSCIVTSFSSFFKNSIEAINEAIDGHSTSPIIFVVDIPPKFLRLICDFMLKGSINLSSKDVTQLLKFAKKFQFTEIMIKLTQMKTDEMRNKNGNQKGTNVSAVNKQKKKILTDQSVSGASTANNTSEDVPGNGTKKVTTSSDSDSESDSTDSSQNKKQTPNAPKTAISSLVSKKKINVVDSSNSESDSDSTDSSANAKKPAHNTARTVTAISSSASKNKVNDSDSSDSDSESDSQQNKKQNPNAQKTATAVSSSISKKKINNSDSSDSDSESDSTDSSQIKKQVPKAPKTGTAVSSSISKKKINNLDSSDSDSESDSTDSSANAKKLAQNTTRIVTSISSSASKNKVNDSDSSDSDSQSDSADSSANVKKSTQNGPKIVSVEVSDSDSSDSSDSSSEMSKKRVKTNSTVQTKASATLKTTAGEIISDKKAPPTTEKKTNSSSDSDSSDSDSSDGDVKRKNTQKSDDSAAFVTSTTSKKVSSSSDSDSSESEKEKRKDAKQSCKPVVTETSSSDSDSSDNDNQKNITNVTSSTVALCSSKANSSSDSSSSESDTNKKKIEIITQLISNSDLQASLTPQQPKCSEVISGVSEISEASLTENNVNAYEQREGFPNISNISFSNSFDASFEPKRPRVDTPDFPLSNEKRREIAKKVAERLTNEGINVTPDIIDNLVPDLCGCFQMESTPMGPAFIQSNSDNYSGSRGMRGRMVSRNQRPTRRQNDNFIVTENQTHSPNRYSVAGTHSQWDRNRNYRRPDFNYQSTGRKRRFNE